MSQDLPLRPAVGKYAFWLATVWVMGWIGLRTFVSLYADSTRTRVQLTCGTVNY